MAVCLLSGDTGGIDTVITDEAKHIQLLYYIL